MLSNLQGQRAMRLLNAGEDIQPEYALELVGTRLAGPACQTQGYELQL
jgi:hypothetical protein